MHVIVDRELCVGAGLCVLSAADLFDQNEEDGQVVLRDAAAQLSTERALAAAQLCPSGALSAVEGTAR
ncbi:(4Fe-4S)-binding protein [Catellatospora sp. KI3]|uniref:ferredoxin n=1 Tax=Catellatospora sp. KI3 TaxID=3041620 RepID=UPI0024831DDB|nr:(4Fe-4S)-binding protein [Catellatospora sp. KI3]MDI1461450.1 (4Fe-4S)-binding protein [Catellatospora sp. KI3]